MTLIAGMDMVKGHVHHPVVARHRSREFVEFLRTRRCLPRGTTLRLILDNHSAHASLEMRTFLASVPNHFEFAFTPKHASWLNLIETFFRKVARTVLQGIRVASTNDSRRVSKPYINELNA